MSTSPSTDRKHDGRTGSNNPTGAPRPSRHYQLAYEVKLHRPVRGHPRGALGTAGAGRSPGGRAQPECTRKPARAFNHKIELIPPALPRQPQADTPSRLVDLDDGHVDARPYFNSIRRTELRGVQEPIHAHAYIHKGPEGRHVPNCPSEDPADGAVFQSERSPSFQYRRRRQHIARVAG